MNKKAVVLGLVGAMALGTCTVSAANGTRNISATFRNIKIVVDGKQVSTSAEPFIYNGTTYLPIRAVGEAVDKEVTWNAGTNTVYLGEVPANAQAQTSAQQQPEVPVPAATTSLPILTQYVEEYGFMSKEDVPVFFAEVRSGNESVYLLAEIYCVFIDYAINNENPQVARSAYAEAQSAFASVTNSPDYADAKAQFEEIWQNDFLPNL